MQTPKSSTKNSAEGARKISPRSVSSESIKKISGRPVRQLKTSGLEPDSAASSTLNQPHRTPKNTSPKITERKSPRSPALEVQKKRPSKVSELESQISQLQDALKTVKDQLVSTESLKQQAQQDASDSRKQLIALSSKLEESQQLLTQPSEGTGGHQNLSEEKDQAWKSMLKSVQGQHLADSAALDAAMSEIKQLKAQLDMVTESEAKQTKQAESAYAEIHILKENMAETLTLVEEMKTELKDCKESESQAQTVANATLLQLETARKTIESVKSEGNKAMEEYEAISSELMQSRARVTALEEIVNKLEADTAIPEEDNDDGGENEMEKLYKEEIISLKFEIGRLTSALEIAEVKYHEQQVRNMVEIQSARELMEQIKSRSGIKEAELEAALKKSKRDIEELKANLMDKETELQGICEENDELHRKLESALSGQRGNELEKEHIWSKQELEALKADLMDKETELQNISEENESLKLEIGKHGTEDGSNENAIGYKLEAARARERESLIKLGSMMEEIEKGHRKIARVTEQLEAAQVTNSEMEAEMRRLKVQSDQWRKAAEAAAAMLSAGDNNNRKSENYISPRMRKTASPYLDDMEDDDEDFLKKKNGNMLKKIGVLWKKPQNKAV